MEIKELNNEEMYCLFAADGNAQLTTLAPSFQTCVSVIKLLHSNGVGRSFHELINVKGYKILPVKVTMIQNADENKPFN